MGVLIPFLAVCLATSTVLATAQISAVFTPSTMKTDPVTNLTGIPWDDERDFQATFLSDQTLNLLIHLSCVNPLICSFNSDLNMTLPLTANQPITVDMDMQALFIGRSVMEVIAFDADTLERVHVEHNVFEVTVLRSERTQMLNNVFTIFMVVFVTVNVFMMGTQLHLDVIVKVLRKPIGPAIGFVCQYILMPLMAYLWARVFLEGYPMLQFGYFAYGCSPGGGNSNFWTILLDGNLDLSITMTFMSNAAALFMMPLWLFTLGQTFYDDTVTIPFQNIVITLFSMLVPALGGMYLGTKKPTWIPVMKKIIKWFTLTVLIVIVFFSLYVNWYIILLMRWYTLTPGFLLVMGGYSISYLIALLLGQRHREARTISIETGIQNAGVAIIICQLSLAPPDSDLTMVMPICCLIFTGMPLWAWLATRAIRRKWCGWHDQDVEDDKRIEEEKKKEKEKIGKLDSIVTEISTRESSI